MRNGEKFPPLLNVLILYRYRERRSEYPSICREKRTSSRGGNSKFIIMMFTGI
jgi:hypothetical protein